MSLLTQLVTELNAGRVAVIDLTQPLGPSTPVIGLPPQFGASPGVTMDQISCFDDKGPAWYWNVIHMGEHTGTHFDAPVHWITGKDLPDNTCDTIPVRRFVGPACVIDVTADVAKNEDFLLTPERIVAWEGRAWSDPRRSVGATPYRLERASGREVVSQRRRRWSPQPRLSQERI